MTPALRLALGLVRRVCSDEHREEVEGDLLELHADRRERRGQLHAELGVLSEALRAALGRPSEALVHKGLRLALVVTATAVGIAYLLLAARPAEPLVRGWPFIMVGTTLELLLWYLLFMTGRNGVERKG